VNVCFSQGDSIKYSTEEIIVTGTKMFSDIYSLPSKVNLFTKKQILNKNGERLSDILQMSGGTYIKSYGGNSSIKSISFNGLGAEHVLILLNGNRMNSFQNSQIDLSLIPKDNIERVEVFNSGFSSIYGSDAIGGVINVITSNDDITRKELSLNFISQYGSYDYSKYSFSASKNFSNVSVELIYSNESSNDDFDYYFFDGVTEVLKQRENSDYGLKNYALNTQINFTQSSKINIYSNYIDNERSIPGIETGSPPSEAKQYDWNWNNILTYENNINRNLYFKSSFNYQNNLMNYENGELIQSYYKNIVYTNNSQICYYTNGFKATAGYDLSYALLKSNEVEDNVNRIQTGMYLVSEIGLFKNGNLKVLPSLRFDTYSDIGKSNLAAKVGLNYKPFVDYKFHIRSSIGNNYRAPTFNELYWKELGNKNLKSEESLNFDAGLIFNFDFIANNTFDVSYTYINVSNKIIWRPNASGLWSPVNLTKSRSDVLAVDLKMDKEFYRDVSSSVSLNYVFTSSKKKSSKYPGDPSFNKQIFYVPQNTFKVNLELFIKNIGVNAYYSFIGRRFTDFENIKYLPATEILDGNVFFNFRLNDLNVTMKFEVNNILNKNYQLISGYPMPLRNYKLGLSLTY
jgi:outer membrane cobalamin receptor